MILREIIEARETRFRWDRDWARWQGSQLGHYQQMGWVYPNGDWETVDSFTEKNHEDMASRMSDQLGLGRSDFYQHQLLGLGFVRWYRSKHYLHFQLNKKAPTPQQCQSLLSMLDNTSVLAGVTKITVNTPPKIWAFADVDSFRDQLEQIGRAHV